MSLFEFKNQAVRDLAWVMRSPGLVSPPSMQDLGPDADRSTATTVMADINCRKIYEQNLGWVVGLERNPEKLEQWLDEHYSHRLGYYFESLLEFWLRRYASNSNLHCHVQVTRQKQTLGEFDYLFQREGDDTGLHLEAAVKFYLRHVDHRGKQHWLGPNANDSLDSKLRRLIQHQLCLGQQPEGLETLNKLGYEKIRSELFLKGYLFYPVDNDTASEHCAGMRISSCHLRGWWCRYPDLKLPRIKPDSKWLVLDKARWLSPAYLDTNVTDNLEQFELLTEAEVIVFCKYHFAEHAESILFAEMIQASEGCWQEIKRGFVVNPKWPVF